MRVALDEGEGEKSSFLGRKIWRGRGLRVLRALKPCPRGRALFVPFFVPGLWMRSGGARYDGGKQKAARRAAGARLVACEKETVAPMVLPLLDGGGGAARVRLRPGRETGGSNHTTLGR